MLNLANSAMTGIIAKLVCAKLLIMCIHVASYNTILKEKSSTCQSICKPIASQHAFSDWTLGNKLPLPNMHVTMTIKPSHHIIVIHNTVHVYEPYKPSLRTFMRCSAVIM